MGEEEERGGERGREGKGRGRGEEEERGGERGREGKGEMRKET